MKHIETGGAGGHGRLRTYCGIRLPSPGVEADRETDGDRCPECRKHKESTDAHAAGHRTKCHLCRTPIFPEGGAWHGVWTTRQGSATVSQTQRMCWGCWAKLGTDQARKEALHRVLPPGNWTEVSSGPTGA